MKKAFIWVLLLILSCLVCLSACEDPKEEMTAEKWEKILGNPIPNTNVTIKITSYDGGVATETATANLDLSHKKLLVRDDSTGVTVEKYYSVENDEFYSYAKNGEGKWEKRHLNKVADDPLGAKSLVDALKNNLSVYWKYFSLFKDKYELFTFDEETRQYVTENFNVDYGTVTLTYLKIAYKFDGEFNPIYVELQRDGDDKLTFELYDYNTTKVSLPKDYDIVN